MFYINIYVYIYLFFKQHREEDYNQDGKYDGLLMNIKIPLKKEEIMSVKMLLMFDYKLHVIILVFCQSLINPIFKTCSKIIYI